MEIDFDPDKNTRNIKLRGISFDAAKTFEWETAVVIPDHRYHYGETRLRAFGFIQNRLHALVFTPREGVILIISLRKANRREVHWYESQTQP